MTVIKKNFKHNIDKHQAHLNTISLQKHDFFSNLFYKKNRVHLHVKILIFNRLSSIHTLLNHFFYNCWFTNIRIITIITLEYIGCPNTFSNKVPSTLKKIKIFFKRNVCRNTFREYSQNFFEKMLIFLAYSFQVLKIGIS